MRRCNKLVITSVLSSLILSAAAPSPSEKPAKPSSSPWSVSVGLGGAAASGSLLSPNPGIWLGLGWQALSQAELQLRLETYMGRGFFSYALPLSLRWHPISGPWRPYLGAGGFVAGPLGGGIEPGLLLEAGVELGQGKNNWLVGLDGGYSLGAQPALTIGLKGGFRFSL